MLEEYYSEQLKEMKCMEHWLTEQSSGHTMVKQNLEHSM
jgi:hypothetical protein